MEEETSKSLQTETDNESSVISKTLVESPPRYAKSSYRQPMSKTPIQAVSIKNNDFSVALGNKMFKNEDFERRMAEVQR